MILAKTGDTQFFIAKVVVKKLGEFDLIYESHESHLYCCECVKKYEKPTPYEIEGLEGSKVVKDYGTLVKVY